MTAKDPAPQLPPTIGQPGLLVGWSLEREHAREPVGFSFGNPLRSPASGYIDPILFEGDGHLITIAPTGSGKGVGCIVPALLRHPGPVIVVDPKGENYAITARRRRAMGQSVHVLDPMGITDAPPEERANLNPIDAIDPEHPMSVDEMSAMVGSLGRRLSADKDQFWIGRATQLLLGLLAHVVSDLPTRHRNLAELRLLVNKAISDPKALAAELSASRHPLAYNLPALLGIGAAETLGGIVAFAQELIDFIRGPMVEIATSSSSFSLDAVSRGDPLSIYIVVPPHMLDSHGQLLRLWISALVSAIVRRRARPALTTLFLLDEAAQLGPLPQLRQAITLLRGYGLLTWSFWQDVSQLKLLYPLDWPTMVNNCRVIQCFGANNMSAAAEMAGLVGYPSAEGVLDLKPQELLLQAAGDDAVYARLPNYLTDPSFAGQFDANPYYESNRMVLNSASQTIRWYLRPRKHRIDPWTRSPLLPEFAPNQAARDLVRRVLAGRQAV